MNWRDTRVVYDQWPYVTMFDALEVVFAALCAGIQIGRRLFEKSRKESSFFLFKRI